MAIADVTGSIKDIMDVSMADRQVELVFRLNDMNIQTSAGTIARINPTATVKVTPSETNGFFTVSLEPTTVMLFDAWYTLTAHWVDGSGPVIDFPGWQIRVPAEGGDITSMVTIGPPQGGWGGQLPNLSLVLVSLEQPDNLQVGQLWLQAAPNNHDNPNPALNTGKLYRGIA